MSLKIGIFVFACAVILLAALAIGLGRDGETKALQLAQGDKAVEIERMEIDGQQRRILCDDDELLAEIAEGFRHAALKATGGISYLLTLRFRGGETFVTRLYVRDDELSVCIPREEEGAPTHRLVFRDGRGAKLTQLISYLDQPYDAVAGSRMIFRAGSSPELEP